MKPRRGSSARKNQYPRVLILGASGFAKVILDALLASKSATVLGFVDRTAEKQEYAGFPCFGPETELPAILKKTKATAVVVAVGDNHRRSLIVERIRAIAPQVFFPTVIHPTAYIAKGVRIGEGTVVLAGAVAAVDSQLGKFCILNMRASISHDTNVGDFASVAPGAALAGNVFLGEFSAVGLGANVIHGIRIGAQTVIGAGAVVLSDLDGHCVAYGVPAKLARTRAAGDKYL